ncbi:MAG: aldehyde dehydrogenase [Brumimicrobium sp.]
MEKIQNFINGEFVPPYHQKYFNNINPSTGETYCEIPNSSSEDVEKAVEAAEKAFPYWSNLSDEERGNWLIKISDGIANRMDEFVQAESRDNGKLVKLAKRVDIPRAISNFRFYGTGIQHYASKSHHTVGVGINYTLRKPIGIVGCISPWNLPLYLFSWKIAPALATGNCVVAKPSEVTPYTAFLLGKVLKEINFPKGVLNIVHGYGKDAGSEIVRHPKITAISFTGGTETGKIISSIAAPMFKKLSLELGGKNPNIIFDDCDFDEMIKTTIHSSFSNQGEICLCGSRIFIQREIYEKFKNAFVEKTKNLKVSFPSDENANLGAIVSQPHYEKILSYIELAQQEGGTILAGGKTVTLEAPHDKGFYIEPTIIEGLSYDCRTNQEEIFGPVVTITPFDTEEEVLKMANSVKYGLSATIWTKDLQRAHRIANQVEAGIIWINSWLVRDLRTPFGGVKASGIGREGGWDALDFFTEPKNVFIPY